MEYVKRHTTCHIEHIIPMGEICAFLKQLDGVGVYYRLASIAVFQLDDKKVYPNGPCPLLGRTRRPAATERRAQPAARAVRICQAALDVAVDTPYLKYAEMAKDIGAWGAVRACCAFCACGACCPCAARGYALHDAERATRRRADMREFDVRVRADCQEMRIMYDKL